METPSNFVFISYSHKDVKWAKWLQRKLEWYRLPTEAHNEFSDSRYIRPVFRDRDTLTSGILNDSLRAHLEASRYLVVICSPNSVKSEWVNNEIKAFMGMGRLERIVPFIVEGDSFPPAIEQWNREHPDKNLLGIAVTDDGKNDPEKAFIRLVAHILELQFDTLWKRHRRFVRRLVVAATALAVVLAALAYWYMAPVKLQVAIQSEACVLPGEVYDGSADDYLSSPVAGVTVTVGGRTAVTDGEGAFRIVFPLEEQSEIKPLRLVKEGFQPFSRDDESPAGDLIYLLDPAR